MKWPIQLHIISLSQHVQAILENVHTNPQGLRGGGGGGGGGSNEFPDG